MMHKIGYIAPRTAVPSAAMQRQKLLDYGVDVHAIYETTKDNHMLDEALASLREGDELVVCTTAIFGRNNLNDTFLTAHAKGAACIHSLRTNASYPCVHGDTGMHTLAHAWKELDDCQKAQIGAVGRQKGGRKRGGVWDSVDTIHEAFNEGISKKELAESFRVSKATITRILESNL